MTIDLIADRVRAGARVTADEALALYRQAPTALLGQLAAAVRARKHAERVVTYIIDRNVNYTNVCVAKCNFCAFYRKWDRPTATSSASRRSFEKSTRRSRSAASSCCCRAATIRICRCPGMRICSAPSRRVTHPSSFTRCRRRRSFIFRDCPSCRFRMSSTVPGRRRGRRLLGARLPGVAAAGAAYGDRAVGHEVVRGGVGDLDGDDVAGADLGRRARRSGPAGCRGRGRRAGGSRRPCGPRPRRPSPRAGGRPARLFSAQATSSATATSRW